MKSTVFNLSLVFRLSSFVIIFSILFTLHSSLFTTAVHAQCAAVPPNTPQDQVVNMLNQCAISTTTFDDKVFNLNQGIGLVNTMNGLVTGVTPVTPKLTQILQNQSALASASKLIAATYGSPPASGVAYFAGQFQKLNPVQPAYAQTGSGFDALRPVQSVWTQFRNVSYVGFVLVFIIIGFMIMFRAKVSPQTVATVQDSIPRIVIALILVTFSYAIVGLIVDFMLVLINIIITALGGLVSPARANTIIFDRNIFTLFATAMPEVMFRTSAEVSRAIFDVFGTIGGTILQLITFGQLGNIGGLIVGIAVLFIMFKIFWMLLSAYISIILLTIFAPFILLFQALPGNNGAQGWLKQLLANVLVFPVVALMLLLAGIFGNIAALGDAGGRAITGGDASAFPLLVGQLDTTVIGFMIGLGFLFMTPSAANMIKERMKAGQGIAFGGAGAAALGASAGFAGRLATTSPAARAFTDLSEQRGRRQTERIVAAAPGWAGGPGRTGKASEIVRTRVRQG